MTNEELIAETNQLLKRLLEIDQEQSARSDELKKEMDERLNQSKQARAEGMKERLIERGVPPDIAAIPEDDWEKRSKETLQRAQANLEKAKNREREYRDELLAELRSQSELLRQIAEKLEK